MASFSQRAAIYTRVSTSQQTVENQLLELRVVAEKMGWHVVSELKDEGISGVKGRDQRPAFDQLTRLVIQRKVDVVLAWDISRLGRSLQHLVEFMNTLQSASVDLYVHQQAIDTSTPSGRMVFGIFASLAAFERELIAERIKSGLARAKAQGVKLGRPSKLNDSVRSAAKCLYDRGMSVRNIAKELGIGIGTVYSCLKPGERADAPDQLRR
jgi:DNA invertase Pin-like site-specific DNA recombinase